ncbi:MAG TPA: phosphatidylglycerophosphatase A, partial [Steroidobacteraceae bacterium]|nr:phosphatidylglycerophosphatase A [Steroidobacteraceae bacterium]
MIFSLATNPRVLRDWRHFLAFGLGSGLARYAPGTFGTLTAIPLYLVIEHLPPALYAVTVAAAFALGVWICDVVSGDLRVHDHQGIVFDEFVGYWITMFMLPHTWGWVLGGFAMFRLFDIWKPGPIRWCDD